MMNANTSLRRGQFCQPHTLLLAALVAVVHVCIANAEDSKRKSEGPTVTDVLAQLANLERQASFPEAVIGTIDARCEEAIRNTPGNIDRERYDAIVASMPKLIESVKGRLDASHVEGAGYWVAYTVAEAVSRTPVAPKEAEKAASNHNAVIDRIVGEIMTHILNSIPVDQRPSLQPEIERKLSSMKAATVAVTQDLRNDALFPGLKAEISEDGISLLLEKFKNPRLYPEYVEPQELMVTKDEAFIKSLDSKLHLLQEDIVYYMIVQPLVAKLKHTEYWGPMDFQIGNAVENDKWPISVSLTPRTASSEKH